MAMSASFVSALRVRARAAMAAALLVCVSMAGSAEAGQGRSESLTNYQNIPLWETGPVPMASGDGPLDRPFLTAFLPPPGRRNGASVIIAPGGANIMLMYGGEGFETAERYNEWGVTAFVLTYRMSPRYNDAARVADGERAVRVVRANAARWNLTPNRIGYIGFSAGSNMGRTIVAQADPGVVDHADLVERVSSRPDYLALVYGPGRATPGEVLKDFPPTFLVSAAADSGPSLGNAQFFIDLTRAGAVAEIHVYQKGRHGFGTGFGSPEFGSWMSDLQRFIQLGGFFGKVP